MEKKNKGSRKYIGYVGLKDIPEGYPLKELTKREVINFEKKHLESYLKGYSFFFYKKKMYMVAEEFKNEKG